MGVLRVGRMSYVVPILQALVAPPCAHRALCGSDKRARTWRALPSPKTVWQQKCTIFSVARLEGVDDNLALYLHVLPVDFKALVGTTGLTSRTSQLLRGPALPAAAQPASSSA